MKADTRLFGEIDIAEDKIITMETGMIGFPNLRRFALIFDEEKKQKSFSIMWFQSMDDPDIAFPVVEPNGIRNDYHPTVSDELLHPLGRLTHENLYILTTVTVPKAVEDMSMNLKAPIIINTDTNRGCQLIVEDDYPVKYKIYQLLKERKEKAGE